MKGQTIILEFILFFFVSFTLFVSIGYFFYSQNQHFSEQVFEYQSEVLNDMLITDFLKANECKSCSELTFWEVMPRKMGDRLYVVNVSGGSVNTTSLTKKPFSADSTIFNLNSTYTFSGQAGSLNKKTQIKINNDGKTVQVV